jgi:cytochrome c biogenesis factor
LGTIARIPWYQINPKISLSSSDQQPNRRVNQILKNMLRAYVIHYGKIWDKYLPLAEFSYNNSYQASLKTAPFEALYG